MALPRNSHLAATNGNCRRGFTLIEVLVVIGLVAIIGGAAAYFGLDTYRGYSFHSDRDLLVAALQHARSQAVGNICLGAGCTEGQAHGVHVESNKLVMFQGTVYNSSDPVNASIDLNANVTGVSPVPTDIVFTQLSATTTGAAINLTDTTGRTSTVTISSEGQIVWTN